MNKATKLEAAVVKVLGARAEDSVWIYPTSSENYIRIQLQDELADKPETIINLFSNKFKITQDTFDSASYIVSKVA